MHDAMSAQVLKELKCSLFVLFSPGCINQPLSFRPCRTKDNRTAVVGEPGGCVLTWSIALV